MQEKKFKHLFFDLDRTLWDYETNCKAALTNIYARLLETELYCGFNQFYLTFQEVNQTLWGLFAENKIGKEQLRRDRFRLTLEKLLQPNQNLAAQVEKVFIREMPSKNKLFDGTMDMLNQLAGQYELHILSNGFDEVQENKLVGSGIRHYFRHVITSDLAGFRKPSPDMFSFALELVGAQGNNSLMIGDDPFVDIEGARNAGMEAILYNTARIPHSFSNIHEISSLSQIPNLISELELK